MSRYCVSRVREIHQYSPNSNPHRSWIPRRLLTTHDEATCNPSKPITSSYGGGDGRPFPLANDVVGLVRVKGSPVGHIRPGSEERPNVAHSDLSGDCGETKHKIANDQAESIKSDEGTTQAEVVTKQ